MGAAGYVTVYLLDEIERKYRRRFPDNALRHDWWYLDTLTCTLPTGVRLVLDYADDQGNVDGVQNDFWFYGDQVPIPDDLYLGVKTAPAGQIRVLQVLRECWKTTTEVWT